MALAINWMKATSGEGGMTWARMLSSVEGFQLSTLLTTRGTIPQS